MRGHTRLDPRLLVLLALAALFYAVFTQGVPYHLDTVGYLESAKESLATGTPPSPLALRFLTIYAYIPFVWLFGDPGIKLLAVSLILGFTACY